MIPGTLSAATERWNTPALRRRCAVDFNLPPELVEYLAKLDSFIDAEGIGIIKAEKFT